jgi:hypothetical protein
MNASIMKIFHEVYFDTGCSTPVKLSYVAFRSSEVHELNCSEQVLNRQSTPSVKNKSHHFPKTNKRLFLPLLRLNFANLFKWSTSV